MLNGAITALVTPFSNGKVDEEAYRQFIEWQIEQGIHGLLPCGTTGESATLTHAEHEQVIRICIDQVKGRVPVLAGVGSNNTAEAVNLTVFAKKVGADAALHITPYYNKPTQEGIYRHFKAIQDATNIPIYVYNVPGRTGSNVLPSTMARMFKDFSNVVGIKEASGNLIQVSEMIELCGPDFCLLSGDDFTLLPVLALGGKGVISVTSNIAPKLVAEQCNTFMNSNFTLCREIHYQLQEVHRAMFLETSPIPVKTALHLMNRMKNEFRLPLCELSEQYYPALKKALEKIDINL